MTAEGIPAYVSNTAGTFLCNQTLYATLHEIAMREQTARAGFIHLPLLPAMVAASGLDQPSMDLPAHAPRSGDRHPGRRREPRPVTEAARS